MPDNSVTIIGNLTRESGLEFIGSGLAVLKLGIACNRRWMKDGEQQEEVSYFDVECWGDLAEHVAESVDKGDRVIVSGRLQQDRWEKDGEKKSKVKIVADSVAPDLRWATADVSRIRKGED